MRDPSTDEHAGILDEPRSARDGEGSDDLLKLLGIVRRRWWLLLLGGLAGLGVTWVYEDSREPTYTAQVLVQREEQVSEVGALRRGWAANLQEEIASELRILSTRQVLGSVVDSLGLRLEVAGRPGRRSDVFADVSISPEAASRSYRLQRSGADVVLVTDPGQQQVAVADRSGTLHGPGIRLTLVDPGSVPAEGVTLTIRSRNQAVAELSRNMRASHERGTNLIRIRYSSTDPAMAAEVANGLADSYLWHAAQRARDEARRTREFLRAQLDAVADSLNAAQDVLLEFLAQRESLNPEAEGETLSSMLRDAQEQVREYRQKEAALQDLIVSLQSGGQEALRQMRIVGTDVVPAAEGLYQQLQQYQSRRRNLVSDPIAGLTETAPEVQQLDSLIAETREEISRVAEQTLQLLRQDRERAQARVGQLRAQVGDVPQANVAHDRLRRRVEAIQKQHDLLASKFYEAQIAYAVETGDAEVVDPATVPTTPDFRGQRRNLAAGFFIGMLLAFGVAFVLDRLDTRIREPDEAPRLARTEMLAAIPQLRLPGQENGEPALMHSAGDPGAESFRMLRTNLRFVKADPPRILQITSAGPEEGKSMVSANLAVALSHDGKQVLLVDGDLRRPVQHTLFELPRQPGLSDVLVGEAGRSAIHSLKDPRIDVITAGTPSPRPAELLGSEAFGRFVERALDHYDAVVIDAPPVLSVTDASVMSSAVDGVILIGRLEKTDRRALSRAAEQLRRTRSPLIGIVVNGVSRGRHYRTYYGYGYGYGEGYGYGDPHANGGRAQKGFLRRILPFAKK